MSHKRIAACAAALAFLAAEGAASAQNNVVAPSVTLDTRYDSNARFRNTKTTDDEGDLVASVNPRIELARDMERYDLDAYYSFTADYHSDNTELNNIAHGAGLTLDAELTRRLKIGAGDRFSYDEDSLRAVGQGILLTRTDILSNNAYVEAAWAAGTNTGIAIKAADWIQEYDDEALVDSRTDSASLTGTYRYSRYGTANASYTFTNFHFETGKDVKTHAVAAGIEESVSSTVNINLGAGAEYAEDLNGGNNEVFLVASAGLEKTLRDSVMNLAFERDITNPTGLTDEISIRDTVTFVWDFTLRRDLFASFYAGLARHRSEPDGRVDINSYIVEASGNWQARRWLILGAGLSHYQQWAEDQFGVGLTRNRVFVNATFTPGEWRF